MRSIGTRFAASMVVALLAITGAEPATAQEEARFCVTVRSESPVTGDLLEAVAAGDATITIEGAAACEPTTAEASAAPTPFEVEGGATEGSGPMISGPATALLSTLHVEPEEDAGYERRRFEHWVDADGDACDARDEVLIAESVTRVSIGNGCAIADGRWVSAFDGIETTDASVFDVDHVVPLKEAWGSGARDWSAAERRRYANDLGDERTLRAVTASSNRSKGDRDPSDWLPPEADFHCQYLTDWIAVKVRWQLTIDRAERNAIADGLANCPEDVVTVGLA